MVVTLFCGIPSAMVYLLNRIMSVALENIAIKDKANMAKNIPAHISLCLMLIMTVVYIWQEG